MFQACSLRENEDVKENRDLAMKGVEKITSWGRDHGGGLQHGKPGSSEDKGLWYHRCAEDHMAVCRLPQEQTSAK